MRRSAEGLLNDANIARALVAMVLIAIGLSALSLGRGPLRPGVEEPDADMRVAGVAYAVESFASLDGWRLDSAAETIPVFLRSCEKLAGLDPDAPANPSEYLEGAPGETLAGKVSDWLKICAAARKLSAADYADPNAFTSAVRDFYEYHFRPVRMYNRLEPADPATSTTPARLSKFGKFTAYFEPYYDASLVSSQEFSAPVYERPADLVTIDLGRFRPALSGERIAGKVVNGALEPFPDHAAINAGALDGRAQVIAYTRPTDLLFLQIQGSGRLIAPGREIRVGYDGFNGHPYTAIGKTLIDRGALERKNVSMKTIRDWLDKASPEKARAVRESNKSYVFFKTLGALPEKSLGPLGAQGVQLTAGRSIAVDPRFTPLSGPVWVNIEADEDAKELAIRRLLIAQDVGGAIKGGVRADLFIGSGPLAGDIAGRFNKEGEMFIFVPAALAERLPNSPRL